ncbi:MAG: MmcQ/YjbR family DNA-binding protein [Clostridia bacterium]|nr:MmcQ/YjbR family DNA-binding protein [Clostridia bacterium]MDE7215132.1 MmcQ/YjbR family DNA-binding protein [Clostridia bacterium]
MDGVFDFKSPNFKKLEEFGFLRDGEVYYYVTDILNGQFEMTVKISAERGKVKTEVADLITGEPYTLHLIEGAGGAFVGAVRAEYERVLTEICESCFEKDVFKGDCAHAVIDYVREKYGGEPEFLWKDGRNAVWRRKDNKKWYGVLMTLSKRKLGLDGDEVVSVIDLRIDPEILNAIADGKKYFRGYHMNKKSWFTMCLDGSVPVEEICGWIDKSFLLAQKG